MASPIRWFRKHAQIFIVVFGVLLMGIFGLGSVFTSLNPSDFNSQAGPENKVVAEWSGGELKKDDLFFLRQKHFAAQQFLDHVYKYAVKENGDRPFPVAVERILPIAGPGTRPTSDEMDEQMMNRFLFQKRAEQEGFIFDENMVFDYIAQYAGDVPLSRNLLKQLNRQVNPQMPLTPVIRQIQLELLSQQMQWLMRGGLPFDFFNPISMSAINPTEAIQLYGRANKRIECQVLPISVEDYVSKVTDEPGESELRTLFEEGKYDYPRSYNFENPGFKVLKQAKVQYFVAEMETFLKNEIAKLTDQEVQEEYDRLVAADDDFVMAVVPENEDSTTAEDSADSENAKVDDSNPAPAPDSSQDGTNESDAAESDADSSEGDDSDSGEDVEKTNTVFKQESNEDADSDQDAGSENELPENELREQSADEKSADEKSADEKSADEQTDANEQEEAPASQEGEEPKDEPKTGDGEPSEGQDPTIEDKPKTIREPKPLKDIADDLKRRMKTEDARIARDEAIDSAEKEIRKFQMKSSKWEYEKDKAGAVEPTPPDFKEIADNLQIQFFETDLINVTQIDEERIGKITTFSFANQQLQQNNVGEQIFNEFESTPVYQPTKVDDGATQSKVLYWMSEKVDQSVPDFKTARESVVKFWKRQKGVELAKAEAQRIADEINNSDKFLKDSYPELAKDTGVFSWFSTFGRFAYGQPAGVVSPGEDFMGTAFSLEDKAAGIALNATRETVYVIQQNTPFVMSLEQIGSDYISKNFFQSRKIPQEVVSAKGMYRQLLNFEWRRELRDHMEVKIKGQ